MTFLTLKMTSNVVDYRKRRPQEPLHRSRLVSLAILGII